jgi:hypothetical protein
VPVGSQRNSAKIASAATVINAMCRLCAELRGNDAEGAVMPRV